MDMINFMTATIGEKIDSFCYPFDIKVFEFFGKMQNEFLTVLAKFFTNFGDEKFVIMVTFLGLILCLFKKTRKYGFAIVCAAVVGTFITNIVLKPMVLRVRPYNTLQDNIDYVKWYLGAGALSESDYCFPSGHTTGAFELAVATGLMLRKNNHKKVAWIPTAIAFCVMGSRVYLMVHYASDVLAACCVGVFAGFVGYFASKLACNICSKIKFIDNIDLEKLFKKEFNPKNATACILAVLTIFFAVSFIPSLSEGGDDAIRCDYNVEYDCQNEANIDVDDDGNVVYPNKYPELEEHKGEVFCKIHWKQLSGEK